MGLDDAARQAVVEEQVALAGSGSLRAASFERFVRALSRPAERPELPAAQGPPTPEQADALAAAAREHGIELVGPPLD